MLTCSKPSVTRFKPSRPSRINQSIKIYFLSNRNITVYTVYASAQKAATEKHTLINLAAQTNKRTQILIQTGRGKDRGEQTMTCAVQVQVETQS